jgi:uncharacterized membrane protein
VSEPARTKTPAAVSAIPSTSTTPYSSRPSSPTQHVQKPTASAPLAPQTPLKTLYDLVGTLITVALTNFVTGPFMLATLGASFRAWSVLDFYGIWIVAGGMAFFYVGGQAWLKGLQVRRVKSASRPAQAETS